MAKSVHAKPVNLIRSDSIEALVAEHLDSTFTAISLMVWKSGEVLLYRAWGEAELDSLFDLASITKLYTVHAFLSHVGEGTVTLDTPLVAWVPEFGESSIDDADGLRPVGQPQTLMNGSDSISVGQNSGEYADPRAITFRQLLTHTAGLAAWLPLYLVVGPMPPEPPKADPTPRADRMKAALAAIANAPFVVKPGESIIYSDMGLILLGEAIARMEGVPLDEAIKARVLNPLGLSGTVYDPVRRGISRDRVMPTELDEIWRGRRCWGEVHDENACGLGEIAGHAGLFAPVADVLMLGVKALIGMPEVLPEALEHDAQQEQIADGNVRKGLGWALKAKDDSFMGELFDEQSFAHTGYTGTSLAVDPTRELVVACLTNRVYFGRDSGPIHRFRRALHDEIVRSIEDGTNDK
jgi:CubicO group peptidase (beta-lactamase class C family)